MSLRSARTVAFISRGSPCKWGRMALPIPTGATNVGDEQRERATSNASGAWARFLLQSVHGMDKIRLPTLRDVGAACNPLPGACTRRV